MTAKVHKLKFSEEPDLKLVRYYIGLPLYREKISQDKLEGYVGVYHAKLKGVDAVHNVLEKLPWKSGTVDEIVVCYLVEKMVPSERVNFVNEAYRVLKAGGKCVIYTPYWCSSTAFGNLENQYPPVSEHWFQCLSKEFREVNDPVNALGYNCDFLSSAGYSLHPDLQPRAQEYQQKALMYWKEAAQDMAVTMIKK
jgi:SAM-dependent methyltransferase